MRMICVCIFEQEVQVHLRTVSLDTRMKRKVGSETRTTTGTDTQTDFTILFEGQAFWFAALVGWYGRCARSFLSSSSGSDRSGFDRFDVPEQLKDIFFLSLVGISIKTTILTLVACGE
jgi:hypothetical protein